MFRDNLFLEKFKKIGIIGIARSGLAAAKKLASLQIEVFLSDSNPIEKFSEINFNDFNVECEFGQHSEKLLEMDLLVISPGVPLNIPIICKAKEKNIPLWSEIELAYHLTHPDTKIIAVTGSNGKSTTVSLINHFLVSAGYNSILAGNIGVAYSSFDIENKKDFIVLELSSFQLDLVHEFKPSVALLLNITPDHLNRYSSFKDYALAKFNIFKNQDNKDIRIVNYDDNMSNEVIMENKYSNRFLYFSLDTKNKIDAYLDNKQIIVNNEIFIENVDDLPLKGPHNQMNILAAILAVYQFVNVDVLNKAIFSFESLKHRLETVGIINGVEFINDSKATNTDSVKYALMSYDKPLHLILGGSDKGEDFSILTKYMKNVKKLYLIGETAVKMKKIFEKDFKTEIFFSFSTVIESAYNNAKSGEIVLLSPACASYDWFQNFEDRGNQFRTFVTNLINERVK